MKKKSIRHKIPYKEDKIKKAVEQREWGAHNGLKIPCSQYQTVAQRSRFDFQQECYPPRRVISEVSGKQLQFLSANNKSQLESHTQFGAPCLQLLTGKEKEPKRELQGK